MKTLTHIALVLVTAAAPVWAQNVSLLGQSAEQTGIVAPKGIYVASGYDRLNPQYTISLRAVPVQPSLRALDAETLTRRATAPEMTVTVTINVHSVQGAKYHTIPFRVSESAFGNSVALLPGRTAELRTRAGTTILAHLPSDGVHRTVNLQADVPPKRPRAYYDEERQHWYDGERSETASEGWLPFVKNVVKSTRKDVRFESDPRHGITRVTKTTTVYGF